MSLFLRSVSQLHGSVKYIITIIYHCVECLDANWNDIGSHCVPCHQSGRRKYEYILKSVADKDYNDALREGHDQGYKECYKHLKEK